MSRDFNLTLEQRRDIKLCEDDRDFILVVDLGSIQESDSLFGFDLGINYDPNLVDMTSTLTTNTIAQFFDLTDTKFSSEHNLISFTGGVLGNLNNPISADRPLIAFFGEFKGSCKDTAKFTLRYFEATQEFKGEIAETTEVSIFGTVDEDNLESLIVNTDEVPHEIKKDSLITIPVSIDYPKNLGLNSLIFKVNIESDSISLNDIEFADDLELVSSGNNEFLFNNVANGIGTINCVFSSTKMLEEEVSIKFEAIPNTDCSCVGKSDNVEISVKNLETDLKTNVLIRDDRDILQNGNKLSIVSENIKSVILTDINGMIVHQINNFENIIDLSNNANGVYILKIIYLNDKSKTKKIIKY